MRNKITSKLFQNNFISHVTTALDCCSIYSYYLCQGGNVIASVCLFAQEEFSSDFQETLDY